MKNAPARRTVSWAAVAIGAATLGAGAGAARAADVTYEIQKSAPPATVGAPAKASITVQGKNGWHVNEEAPITITLKSDEGIALPKAKMVRADLAQSTKESARFDIPYSASSTGKKTITAEARFVMCQAQACKPAKETVALEIQVADAAPAGKDKTPAKGKAAGKSKSVTN